MCIRDRSEAMEEAARKSDLEVLLADMQGSIIVSAPANGRFALLTAEMFGAVSYTHLDVYKRQDR